MSSQLPTNLNELGQLLHPTPVPVTGVRVYGVWKVSGKGIRIYRIKG
jgi:hypothetical protein